MSGFSFPPRSSWSPIRFFRRTGATGRIPPNFWLKGSVCPRSIVFFVIFFPRFVGSRLSAN